jgi:hypothetical protein
VVFDEQHTARTERLHQVRQAVDHPVERDGDEVVRRRGEPVFAEVGPHPLTPVRDPAFARSLAGDAESLDGAVQADHVVARLGQRYRVPARAGGHVERPSRVEHHEEPLQEPRRLCIGRVLALAEPLVPDPVGHRRPSGRAGKTPTVDRPSEAAATYDRS